MTHRPRKLPNADPIKPYRITLSQHGICFLGGMKAIHIGGHEWMPLLDEINSFSYRGISMRKEARRNGQYWYAFKKVNGTTRKIYCGWKYDFCRVSYFEALYQRFEDMKHEGYEA